MRKFVALKTKLYNNLIEDVDEDKNAKGTKKCVIKWKFKFKEYKSCLKATQLKN